jgi:hypothetical protein
MRRMSSPKAAAVPETRARKLADRRSRRGRMAHARVQDAAEPAQGPRTARLALPEGKSRQTYEQEHRDEATHG